MKKLTNKKQLELIIKKLLKEKTLVAKAEIEKHTNDYKEEVKKAVLTAVVAAFSFLMALEWREVIKNYVNSLLELTSIQGDVASASIITLLSVLAILIFTKVLGVKEVKDEK